MLSILAKRWFLLLLVAGVALAWLWPAPVRWTTAIHPQPIMALALFLSAWTLESRALYSALLRPWPAVWATVISFGLLPGLGWLSGALLPVADFQIGLMICASVPCTLASAVLWTRMAGGSEATALLTTFLTTGTSWLATTAWLSWTTGQQAALDTANLMRDLAITLVVPVGAGQLARAGCWLREAASRHKAALGIASRGLILVIMLQAAVSVMSQLEEKAASLGVPVLLGTAGLCVGNHVLALVSGLWTGRLFGFDRAACIAVGIAGSQKTLPVSLWLLKEYFSSSPLAVVPMLFYHVGQLIVDTFIADQWAAGNPEATPQEPARTAAEGPHEPC